MTTITWIEATIGAPRLERLWTFLAEQVAVLADGRVETRIVHAPFDAGGIRTPANRLASDLGVLAAAVGAVPASDAIVLGCWGAPTQQVRAASAVPVSSLAEGSVRTVASLAANAVVVTVAPALAKIFADDIQRLGTEGFFNQEPVRSWSPESTHDDILTAIDDPAVLIDRFDKTAAAAINAGADAIVVGCGYLAPIFTAHGYTHPRGHAEVPILDCNRMALEHALHLLALSQAGIAPTPVGYVRPADAQAVSLNNVLGTLAQRTAQQPKSTAMRSR